MFITDVTSQLSEYTMCFLNVSAIVPTIANKNQRQGLADGELQENPSRNLTDIEQTSTTPEARVEAVSCLTLGHLSHRELFEVAEERSSAQNSEGGKLDFPGGSISLTWP